jgi:hypothetical protein
MSTTLSRKKRYTKQNTFYENIHFYEFQKWAKPTLGDGNQNNDCLWELPKWRYKRIF